MATRKYRNSTCFIIIIIFFDNYFCVIELCLCCLNSLARCLPLCLSVCSAEGYSSCCQPAASLLMLTSASWESRCLRRLINAVCTSLRSLIYLLNCYAYISTTYTCMYTPHTYTFIHMYPSTRQWTARADDQENKEVHSARVYASEPNESTK